jgi:hypothetical protein
MRRLMLLTSAGLLAVLGLSASGSQASAPAPAMVTVVQAVPGAAVDVRIDDRSVATAAEVGAVLGPFELAAGDHAIRFGGDVGVDSTLSVSPGDATDVVVHLPAQVGGDPVVSSYAAPTGPIGPDKARVLLAHTATVAPADVQVDGQTVFTNIANGEYADADVPGGTIRVALLPSGTKGDPILGPVDVDLASGTLSMIYAYGNPRDGSMNVIAHTETLEPDGSVQPSRIETGSAGLIGGSVTSFEDDGPARHLPVLPWVALVATLAAVTAASVLRRGRAARPRG